MVDLEGFVEAFKEGVQKSRGRYGRNSEKEGRRSSFFKRPVGKRKA